MKRSILFFIVFCIASTVLYAAGVSIKGKIISSSDSGPLAGATAVIYKENGTKPINGAVSKNSGYFEIKDVKPGKYRFEIQYIGFNQYKKTIIVKSTDISLGSISLDESSVQTSEVEVTAKAAIAEQKHDTTEFIANSFKTQPDAAAEDLVKKIPGVEVQSDGTVKAQGEQVQKVLVDGKQFMGDDPATVLKNLPADVVDRIQVFDKQSEQSQFTGFDDGNSQKALNIITKPSKRTGQFGKFAAEGGSQDRYNLSANYSIFNPKRRLSVVAMSNNVNQQNFSFSDIMGLMGSNNNRMPAGMAPRQSDMNAMRNASGGGNFGGPGNFLTSQLDGISKTNAIGINYIETWSETESFTLNYFMNATNNNNNQFTNREYFSLDTTQFYLLNSLNNTKNYNHKLNMELRYNIDSSNSIYISPTLNFQKNTFDKSYFSTLTNNTVDSMINKVNSDNSSNYSGYNFNTDMMYRTKFAKPGRTFSVGVNVTANDKSGSSDQLTHTSYYKYSPLAVLLDTLDQQYKAPTSGYGVSANAMYTEPLFGKSTLLSVNYLANMNHNSTDKKTYDYAVLTNDYSLLDSLLSNKFDNDYFTQRAGFGIMWQKDKMNFQAQLNYQQAQLKADEDFPTDFTMKYKFYNLLPSMMFRWNIDDKTRIRLFYRTNTNSPSVTQLQNVLDNSNATQLSIGNPDLKQQYNHTLNFHFSTMGSSFSNMFMTMLAFSYRNNYIGNSIFIASKDTTVDNIKLASGSQLTRPVNLDGYWTSVAFLNYGFPVRLISSNVNLSLGSIITSTPSLLNNLKNTSNSYNLNSGIFIGSNISQDLDFSLSTRYNYNITKNSLRTDQNNDYYNITSGASLKWIIWEGFFVSGDYNYTFYNNSTTSPKTTEYSLLNLSIGKKFFHNMAELKLTCYDVLKQNKSIETTVTDYYKEYVQNDVLKQYITLSFTYNLRIFGSKNINGEEETGPSNFRRPPDGMGPGPR